MRFLQSGENSVPADAIGVGDTLSISVFEAGPGLFSHQSSDGGGATQSIVPDSGAARVILPNLQVDAGGCITVPYAGKFEVAGLSPEDAGHRIEIQFKGKSLQPQVVVSIVDRVANSIMIYGDIKNPGRYPLTLAHEKLLDMVALASGATHSANDTVVTLIRHDHAVTLRLSELYVSNEKNVVLLAGDRIELQAQPRVFTVFGGAGKASEISFDQPQLSLAQGVARSGGPNDAQADPTAVYLFRYETAEVAKQLGLTVPEAPVIYRLNLMEPASYFAMQKFAMRDRDMIYIANAPTNRLQKALNLFGALVSSAVVVKTVSP
jgi:polysaccharide export outer membrane protein